MRNTVSSLCGSLLCVFCTQLSVVSPQQGCTHWVSYVRARDECIVGDADSVTDSLALTTSFRGVKALDDTGASHECRQGRKAAMICEGNRRDLSRVPGGREQLCCVMAQSCPED